MSKHTDSTLPATSQTSSRQPVGPARTSKSTAPRRRLKQAERRSISQKRLILATIKLISERGSAGTSLTDVGVTAGYSRGLPGEHFGSKLGLLEAVIDHMFEWLDQRITGKTSTLKGMRAVLNNIECHIDAAIESPSLHKALYHLQMDSISIEPSLRSRMARLESGNGARFLTHLREAQASGELHQDVDIEQQASLIIGTMRGVIIQALVTNTPETLHAKKKALTQMFALVLTGKDDSHFLNDPLR